MWIIVLYILILVGKLFNSKWLVFCLRIVMRFWLFCRLLILVCRVVVSWLFILVVKFSSCLWFFSLMIMVVGLKIFFFSGVFLENSRVVLVLNRCGMVWV